MKRETAHAAVAALALAALAALGLAACARPTPPVSTTPIDRAAEATAIRGALHDHVERSSGVGPIDLQVAQIGIDSDYALVTWMHEAQGGQAVLRKEAGQWQVLKCGNGWLGVRGVFRQRVPDDVAKRLLDQVDPNWPSYEPY
ncbi:MAG TPA: hypothetical protein VF121_15550 [Thermoanaerobaculia bacterium]|nr:hypothetical protein [Thermoanaerobaculia bacterium]